MFSGASELNTDYIESNAEFNKHTQIQQKDANYIRLCNKVYEANFLLSYTFLYKQEYLSKLSERQKAKKHIKILQQVISEAKKRIEIDNIHKEHNEKVFYSSIALKNILEEVCDERFMCIVGPDNIDLEHFDIIAYAKGILKAENEI